MSAILLNQGMLSPWVLTQVEALELLCDLECVSVSDGELDIEFQITIRTALRSEVYILLGRQLQDFQESLHEAMQFESGVTAHEFRLYIKFNRALVPVSIRINNDE